ncbi:MAG TPA: alkaline phosphatase family protein, partial [Solirubrobacteraceae bacterium]|nr:alkaline phosphatase family protein [Solirubrobacteraceae bacterium]
PTAPAGTAGEYLTVSPLPSDAGGVSGPIGLGFRVPMLVASPFARGGFVCSDTFDHTSTLRFLETRFGAEVPNLSAWRRSVTGDLTTAFNFAAADRSVPPLPEPSLIDSRVLTGSCVASAPAGLLGDINATIGQLSSTLVPGYPASTIAEIANPSTSARHTSRAIKKLSRSPCQMTSRTPTAHTLQDTPRG